MIDWTSAAISFDLIYPEIALLAAAFLILLTGSIKNLGKLSPAIALLGMVVSLGYAIGQWGHQQSGFSGMIS